MNHKKDAKIFCTCKRCHRKFEINNLMDILENKNPSMVAYSARSSSSRMFCSCGGSDFQLSYEWGK